MSRVVHKGVYTSDILGTDFSRRVDDHFFTQAALGWASADPGTIPLPSSLRPRHAVGVDSSGRRHSVVVPVVGADVWTRTTNVWFILDDAGANTSVTVTGLVGEGVTL